MVYYFVISFDHAHFNSRSFGVDRYRWGIYWLNLFG